MSSSRIDPQTPPPQTPDRIEKELLLRSPRSRVWRALVEAEQFGSWFGVKLDPAAVFRPGARVKGRITIPGYETWPFELAVERLEPEHLFSYRWHPYPEPGVDLSAEPTTLVEFRLEDAPGGSTRLTVVESGFHALPAPRRAKTFQMNDHGWSEQLRNIARHVST